MKPARTASQLLEQLDAEFSWRLQEVASLRKAIRQASGIHQSALLRAAVPLLYAHWEGFVKTAAVRYAAFISTLGITFDDARTSFAGLKALGYVKRLHGISKRVFVASELLSALYNIGADKVSLNLEAHVGNIGNLNYDLFEQIINFLSLESMQYAAKKPLIDESLLKQRNEIAHGDYLLIDANGFETLSDEILTLMRQFKADIENAVVLKAYLRSPPGPEDA